MSCANTLIVAYGKQWVKHVGLTRQCKAVCPQIKRRPPANQKFVLVCVGQFSQDFLRKLSAIFGQKKSPTLAGRASFLFD